MNAWLTALRLWLRARLRPDLVDRDLNEELEFHLNRQSTEHVAAGMAPADAGQLAMEQLGNVEAAKARIRRAADEGIYLAFEDWRSESMLPRVFNLKTLVITSVIVGALAGYVAARGRPPLYRAQALLQVVRPEVAGVASQTSSTSLRERLQAIQQTVLSRTRLERILLDFDLYPSASKQTIMEDRVEEFRSNIDFELVNATSFAVRFTGTDPMTVMKVTERLAAYFKDENAVQQERVAQNSVSFLESQAEEVGNRLDALQARAKAAGTLSDRRVQLEAQVLEATYTRLLTSLEDARGRANLERRQIGETFVLLDAARKPEKPITPTTLEQTWRGAIAGLLTGVILAAAIVIRRIWRNRPRRPSMQEAAGQ